MGAADAVRALLLRHGAWVTLDWQYRSPLHVARSPDVVAALLGSLPTQARQPLLESRDRYGRTPLYQALELRNLACAHELLLWGASLDGIQQWGHVARYVARTPALRRVFRARRRCKAATIVVLGCRKRSPYLCYHDRFIVRLVARTVWQTRNTESAEWGDPA